jgi:la-related protein 1
MSATSPTAIHNQASSPALITSSSPDFVPSIWSSEGAAYADQESLNTKVFPSPLSTVFTLKNNQNDLKDETKMKQGSKVIKGTHVSPYKYFPRTPLHEQGMASMKQDRMSMLDDDRRDDFDYDPECYDDQQDLEFNYSENQYDEANFLVPWNQEPLNQSDMGGGYQPHSEVQFSSDSQPLASYSQNQQLQQQQSHLPHQQSYQQSGQRQQIQQQPSPPLQPQLLLHQQSPPHSYAQQQQTQAQRQILLQQQILERENQQHQKFNQNFITNNVMYHQYIETQHPQQQPPQQPYSREPQYSQHPQQPPQQSYSREQQYSQHPQPPQQSYSREQHPPHIQQHQQPTVSYHSGQSRDLPHAPHPSQLPLAHSPQLPLASHPSQLPLAPHPSQLPLAPHPSQLPLAPHPSQLPHAPHPSYVQHPPPQYMNSGFQQSHVPASYNEYKSSHQMVINPVSKKEVMMQSEQNQLLQQQKKQEQLAQQQLQQGKKGKGKQTIQPGTANADNAVSPRPTKTNPAIISAAESAAASLTLSTSELMANNNITINTNKLLSTPINTIQGTANYLKEFSLIPPSSPDIQNPLQKALITQLQLSPLSKYLYKEFSKTFKDKEKDGFAKTVEWTSQNLAFLPQKIHWKIYLQLADLAKRENQRKQAKYYYQLVNETQPYAAKGWIEYAKMKEENGNLKACTNILGQGLFFCPHNESLLVKGIKHSEKMGDINCARSLLAKLKSIDIERSWRTMMEGALLEARQGNIEVAKQIFKYLMAQVPSYGPIYTEAARLEIKMEQYEKGRALVFRGLQYTPTYGPLIFLLLKLEDLMDGDYRACVKDALPKLSKELVWKIWFELAQIEHRRGLIAESNAAYVQAAKSCPNSSVWKVWLGGARTEILNGRYDIAEKLLQRAMQDVQQKLRSTVFVEFSRFYEYLGSLDESRKILVCAQNDSNLDWKVFLELVLLEVRANDLKQAMVEVKNSLEKHPSTGRLWAILIQLTHLSNLEFNDVSKQKRVFVQALGTVPKSGEVWCEGARIALHQHLLNHARKYLEFAIQFTPQYGDSFIELMRLEMLVVMDHIIDCGSEASIELALEDPDIKEPFDKIERLCINAEPTYGVCWSYCKSEKNDILKNYIKNALAILIEMANIAIDIQWGGQADLPEHKKLIYSNLDITAYFLAGNQSIHSRGDSFKFKAIFG